MAATALFGSRVPRVVIGLIVIVVVVEGAYIGGKYLLTPWARDHSGRPPLVGYWQGEMTIEPGDTRHVALYLREFETVREFLLRGSGVNWDSTPRPDIRVAVKVCGPKRSVRYYGHGAVVVRDGTRFTFGLAPEAPELGKHPTDIEGIWDGKDRLDLTSRLYTQDRDGATAEASATAGPGGSGNGGVIRFQMRRISERAFDDAC